MMNRMMFIDMNSFFASVEQQERPELRGQPVIVAPVLADSTVAIAASYEAKPFGIKTGTSVKVAKKRCPGLHVVEGRPKVYRQYHERIVEVLNDHFATIKVLSVDEMACRVAPLYAGREAEARLAGRVKAQLYRDLGPCLRCSIGVAPNVFLAKVGSDMQKPDGLTILDGSNLPDALFPLRLIDLPGIGSRMEARLLSRGICSVKALWEASPTELRRAWGSVAGERWHHMLRGSQVADYESSQREVKKSVGHSHVLPHEFRSRQGAEQILMRLLSKCLKRLRLYNQASSTVHLHVGYRHDSDFSKDSWDAHSRAHAHSNDDITWTKIVRSLIDSMPAPEPGFRPISTSVTFTDLLSCEDVTLSLFDESPRRARLAGIVDHLNARFGHVVDLGSVYWLQDRAPYRIAFGANLLGAKEVA